MPSLSDLPPPPRPSRPGSPRVVTLGGGHGQAALLAGLSRLECNVTAIVSVADDGGCSGKLRRELGMAPPGDVRRCLVSLATRPDVAARFEERLSDQAMEGRCVGNLVLAALREDFGDFQRAVDWAATMLGCVGRVVPVADAPGTLGVWDVERGVLVGESNIEKLAGTTLVAAVHGPERASAHAIEAIERADIVFFGPGSFVGSTLAALTTGDIAEAVVSARARRVLVHNLAPEAGGPIDFHEEHARVLRDHLVIGSRGQLVSFDRLAHDPARTGRAVLTDGSIEWRAPLADGSGRLHDPLRVAAAIGRLFSLGPRDLGWALAHDEHARAPGARDAHADARSLLERYLDAARVRLFELANAE
jgi:uncharacterized cofD-like protein